MWRILKLLFGSVFEKSSTKTIIDSRLGKLTCDYTQKDQYFSWRTELTNINQSKAPTAIYIDGDLNGPYAQALDMAKKIIDKTAEITTIVQKELDLKFPDKQLNLSKGYILDDLSFFYDPEDPEATDFEVEYFSETTEMVSAGFRDNIVVELDLY